MSNMHFKLTSLARKLLTAACLVFVVGTASAQSGNVSFSGRSMTAKQAFSEITKQTGYMFVVNHSVFNESKVVTFAKTGNTVAEAMARIVQGTGCAYEVKDRHILIVPAPKPVVAPRYHEDYTFTTTPVTKPPIANPPVAKPLVVTPPKEPVPETKTTTQVVTREVIEIIPVDTLYKYPQQTKMVINTKVPSARNDRFGMDTPPAVAVKTNLLYGAAALAPNLAVEIGLGRRTSLDLFGSYNPWNLDGSEKDNKKLVHWVVKPEFRYWLCERFNGHFFGLHGFYGEYNISQHKLPMLFDKEYRYEGNVYGGGITYGYHLILAKRWSVEFHVGVGVAQFKYEKYDCTLCSDVIENKTKTYFGPTRAGISLVFMIR